MKFLVKEIRSKTGELHFRRYRIFSCPLFSIFIHRIYRSDEDLHPHNHPWNFVSIILSGGYVETLYRETEDHAYLRTFYTKETVVAKPFSILRRKFNDYHKIELVATTTSLVFTGRRKDDPRSIHSYPMTAKNFWGYLVRGSHISAGKYRELKDNGELPS